MSNQEAVDAGVAFIKADVPTALTGIYYNDGNGYEKGATSTVELVEKADEPDSDSDSDSAPEPDSTLSMVA